MKRLIVLAAVSASLMASACITVIDADSDDHVGWHGQNAQPFDGAREDCRARTGRNEHSDAFAACMAEKGWTRGED
ncbi:hypothetical protein [Brevundimonas sp.]|uniref:hypothetical protein n=1 Tax=Brevundimonas sp. TaxID=1871086 RepID=UPI002ED82CF6